MTRARATCTSTCSPCFPRTAARELSTTNIFCSSGSFCAPARASLAAPGPGIIKFGAFDGESTLSIFEFHCLLRPEYRLPCTPLKSFRLALALTTVIDYVQTDDVVWKGGEEAALFQNRW